MSTQRKTKRSTKTPRRPAAATARAPPGSKTRAARNLAATSQVGLKPATRSTNAKPNRDPGTVLRAQLTGQDQAVADYLTALTVPGYPGRVPLSLGDFELITNTYEYVFNGTCVAGAAGCAYVTAAPDGWLESGNDGGPAQQIISYQGGTQGYPVWNSIANATTTPATGAASGVNDGKTNFAAALDPGFDATIRYRLVALILEAWPDSSSQTTQGDITIAAVATEESMNDAALNSATFASIAAYPREYVNHEEFALGNWPSGHVAAINMVPYGTSCVSMSVMPAAGMSTAPYFGVAAVGAGMASGQTFRYRITYKYETTAPRTYITNIISTPTTLVEPTRLGPHLSALAKIRPSKGPRQHIAARPLVAIQEAEPTLWNKMKGLAKTTGLGKVVSAGLKHVPFVGGLLSGAADWLLG